MLEAADIVAYTAKKQELQLVAETLFDELMATFDLAAFLANPRGYTRAMLLSGAYKATQAIVGDAYAAGKELAGKARG
jgi:hypothetical protein